MKEKFDDVIKKVCSFHDLSCLGGRSLTEIIPILSTFGIRTNPVLTVILSNHSEYEKFTYHDLTDHMIEQKEIWKEIGVKFDAFFSGFLGSPEQIEIVIEYIEEFNKEDSIVIVDPVMGDEGEFFPSISNDMIYEMKKLVKKANVISPNWTEACFLAEYEYKENPTYDDLRIVLNRLKKLSCENIVITSFPSDDCSYISTIVYRSGELREIKNSFINKRYPGTGDAFSSVLLGGLLSGYDLFDATKIAVEFIEYSINFSKDYDYSEKQGILLEACLPTLFKYNVFNK